MSRSLTSPVCDSWPARLLLTRRSRRDAMTKPDGSGPFVQEAPGPPRHPARAAAQEVIGEIRVHGNASVTDEDVLQLAG